MALSEGSTTTFGGHSNNQPLFSDTSEVKPYGYPLPSSHISDISSLSVIKSAQNMSPTVSNPSEQTTLNQNTAAVETIPDSSKQDNSTLSDNAKNLLNNGIFSERCVYNESSTLETFIRTGDVSTSEKHNTLTPPNSSKDSASSSDIHITEKQEEMERTDSEDLVECGNCDGEFQTLQEYMDHTCAGNSRRVQSIKEISGNSGPLNQRDLSDVESFDGKIVYNPDGSAYIIEGDSDSELESMIDLPQKEGAIVDKKGRGSIPVQKEIPQIDNAFFVPRNPNSFLHNPFMLPHKSQCTPIMHSYRVFDLRSKKSDKAEDSGDQTDESRIDTPSSTAFANASTSEVLLSSSSQVSTPPSLPSKKKSQVKSVPTKPILMCFICKLSFGFAKSFTLHAVSEHSMELSAEEKAIMSGQNASAIIQGIGKEKEPLMSFLEPIKSSGVDPSSVSPGQQDSNSGIKTSEKAGHAKETTSVSYIHTKPKFSDSFSQMSPPSNQKHGKDLSIRDIRHQVGKNFLIDSQTSPSNAVFGSYDRHEKNDANDSKRQKLDLNDDSSSNSQSNMSYSAMQRYFQDQDYASNSPKSFLPPFTSSQRPSFYGACEEHPNGRAPGVECPSCDMVLSSSQSLGGHMTMMHSRNSCKTLKCPKCNWHYKYQETLEIHMKEKHPEGDQKCMYCLTNQSHPRLARGESYSCGYKPYRCEVCNYSTTTKGNLSIHMQSDKHLNNVQDLANSGGDIQQLHKHQAAMSNAPPILQTPPQMQQTQIPPKASPSPSALKTPPHQQLMHQQHHSQMVQSHTPSHSQSHGRQADDSAKKSKPKPTWRCDVCNYETNVARNLRIHMTSEKHTHNMMVLQQNMKHLQRDMQIHQMNQLVMLQQDPSFLGLSGPVPGGITFPYDGSLMMGGIPTGFGDSPVDLSKENGVGVSVNGELQDVSRLFQCCVCNVFGTDSLESLHQHLQMDRTKSHENDNITIASGTYMCNLCQYKTTLKANFQLHCKTDKHIQRLQLVNHIKEGGAHNEWRLKYLNVSNPVQVRCNCCDYYTNSIHKLQIHTGNPRHEASGQLFCHLQQQESLIPKSDAKAKRAYVCNLCRFNARTKLGLMQHVHSMQHLHSEGLKQMEMKETGQLEVDIGEIFSVKEVKDLEAMKFDDEAGPSTLSNGLVEEESSFPDGDNSEVSRDRTTTPLSPACSNNNNNNNTIKQNIDDIAPKGDVKLGVDNKQVTHDCPYCSFSTLSEMQIKSHLSTQHANHSSAPPPDNSHNQSTNGSSNSSKISLALGGVASCCQVYCPLCQEPCSDKSRLQKHLTLTHNVNTDVLQKLLALVEDQPQKMPPATLLDHATPPMSVKVARLTEVNLDTLEQEMTRLSAEDGIDTSVLSDKDGDDQFRCQTCSKSFVNIDQLYSHQNELGHLELKQTPRGPGYLCWKKGCNQYFKTAQALQMHFREIHAKAIVLSSSDKLEYQFRCQICTIAFKSQSKLHAHAQMHIIKSAVTCNLCSKTFPSIDLLRSHVQTAHDLGDSEFEQYKAEIYANTLAFATFMHDPHLGKIFTTPDGQKENLNADKLAITENGIVDAGVSSKDRSPSSLPHSLENGIEKGDLSDVNEGDVSTKDQQILEDYINSPTIAEGGYDDPNRKFKCHRCRVAFTKQHYLAIHNKTAAHKTGQKVNNPMEKFLDPNRPYKCDVCKESFTQKNILLVHYNSVSHLHKIKQHMVQTEGGPELSLSPALSQSPHPGSNGAQSSRTSSPAVPLANNEKMLSAKKSREPSPAEDDSQKPYKCNICKVSYSQGSTLDIHIRSVAHQTRATKLHELAMSGEVDLSRPLIEEPMDKAQQKLLNDFLSKQTSLSQQSLLFPGLPGLMSFPGFPGVPGMPSLPMMPGLPPLLPLSLASHMFPTSVISSSSSQTPLSRSKLSSESPSSATKSLEKISQQSQALCQVTKEDTQTTDTLMSPATATSTSQHQPSGSIQVCQRCSAVFANADSFIQHQILCAGSSASPSPIPTTGKTRLVGRVKTAVQRNLLENFGFECVMQFNEFNQRAIRREEEVKEKEREKERAAEAEAAKSNESTKMEVDEEGQAESASEVTTQVKEEKVHLPEMNKSKCTHCNKQFSSVWVLKAHEEEVHKEIVPLEIVEEVGDKFKSDFEKKLPKEPAIPEIPTTPVSVTPTPDEKIIKQEMPPPPPPPSAATAQLQMDMLQMMNMFGMGMPMPLSMPLMAQPSLMPMMMPPPGLDMPGLGSMDQTVSAAQRRQMEQNAANQKRARTRINDEQLKVLRGYFDINNSPTEEQIQAMSDRTGLPMKVIKHWFRNTLFKERQRNKDSPYNFNNPPSTTLDLEEYEKTGKLTIVEESPPQSKSPSPANFKPEMEIKKELPEHLEEISHSRMEELRPPLTREHMSTPVNNKHNEQIIRPVSRGKSDDKQKEPKMFLQTAMMSPAQTEKSPAPRVEAPSVSPVPQMTSPSAPGSSSFMQNFVAMAGLSTPSTPNFPPTSSTPTSIYDSHNYSPPGSGSTGRRANRTRFTDYQIKCLQEYFEQNAYPKDDELEHLSKMLGLSPRVIVVWFQNARQKARKIYENQPADNVKDSSGNSPYNRTSGLNYQCKKCQAVFQRYYDLIRHQKRSCFTDAEKESHMMSDDSDSISYVTSLDNTAFSDSESENSNFSKRDSLNTSGGGIDSNKKFQCDKCEMSFSQYETYREHQSIHNMYSAMNLSGGGAFGMLQTMAANSTQQGLNDGQSPSKRKYEDDEEDQDQPKDKRLRTTILPEQLDYLYQKYQIDCNPSRKQLEAISKDVGLKKRVVQVWFQNTRARERKGQYRAHQQLIHKRCPVCRALFRAKSALESHLASKHPDEMAKGEINIDTIPDAAIESPGPSSSNLLPPSPDYNKLLAPPAMAGLLPYMPPASLGGLGLPPMADPIQLSMKQFYEDSYKKYINELSSTSHSSQKGSSSLLPHEFTTSHSHGHKVETNVHTSSSADDEAPLDLSKPLKVSTKTEAEKNQKEGPMSQSSFSSGEQSSAGHGSTSGDRSRHNSGRNSVHSILGSAVDQTYMMNRFNHDSALHHGGDHDEMSAMSNSPASPANSQTQSNQGSGGNKRYRTQMTSQQVRVMKHIFQDYKTPTMAECEMLGRVIGLQKRVVQVWFQNARAKEKKAKLNLKSYNAELDFPKPPEECSLCNFKYSHKYTIQDHIFTKKHIDKVREYIHSQSDAEREISSSTSMAGVSSMLQTSSDMEQMRKMMMDEASTHSQMAQLQSMGFGPLSLPPSAMAGMGLLPPDILQSMKKESSSSKEGEKSSSKSEGSSRKETNKGGAGASGSSGDLGSMFSGMDPTMLQYMYGPGLPGLMPGGMPPLGSGLIPPGADHLLGYDPMTYGTPLPLLQIPSQAIKDVSTKLMDPKATIGQYTQDCKSISSLRSLVSSTDYNLAQEAIVDVGYICKKCQMVYPAKEACVSHQRLMCFPGGKIPDGVNITLKLEQIQYECKLCTDKVSTVQEFKSHCNTESHKTKLAVFHQQRHSSTPKSMGPSSRQNNNNTEFERPGSADKPLQS